MQAHGSNLFQTLGVTEHSNSMAPVRVAILFSALPSPPEQGILILAHTLFKQMQITFYSTRNTDITWDFLQYDKAWGTVKLTSTTHAAQHLLHIRLNKAGLSQHVWVNS